MDNFIPLDSIQLATPCSADWSAMPGDSRTRFCTSCAKNVYNLSDMTRAQAEALVNEKEGRMCAVFYRRADGTVLTDDCPVPLRPVRNGARYLWRATATAFAAIAAIGGSWLVRAAEAAPRGSVAARTVSKVKNHQSKKATPTPTPPPLPVPGGIAPPPVAGGISVAPPTVAPAPEIVVPHTTQQAALTAEPAGSRVKVIQVPATSPASDEVVTEGVSANGTSKVIHVARPSVK